MIHMIVIGLTTLTKQFLFLNKPLAQTQQMFTSKVSTAGDS